MARGLVKEPEEIAADQPDGKLAVGQDAPYAPEPPPPDTQHPTPAQRLLPHLVVLLAFTVLTIVATWPMFPHLGGYVVDKGDPLYSVWAMAWQAHALATNPLGLFDTNVMYPFRGTLAFDELSFAQALMAAPLYYLSGNPVLSHNAVLLGTFVLSGYFMWLLVRQLTGSGWAGFVAGSAFAFAFYRIDHLPHITLISMEWMPLILLAAYKLIWTGSWRWALVLSAAFTVQALSGHYLAFYSAMLLGLFFAYYLLVQRRLFSWKMIGKFMVGMAGSLALMLPILIPYSQVQGEHDFKRDLFEVERFSNTLSSFLAIYKGNPLYKSLLSTFADPGPWAIERSAFPGFGVIILGLIGVWMVRRSRVNKAESGSNNLRTHTIFYAIIALLSAFLSLGPSLQITYASSNYDPNTVQRVLPLPYLLLYDWIPGFQSMRVVARIDTLMILSLSILAGIGAYFLLSKVSSRAAKGRLPTGMATAGFALLLALVPIAESWSVPNDGAAVGTRQAVPPVYRWLSEQPRTVILEYPMVYYKPGDPNVEMANLYQYYTAYHWQNEVNGSTTIRPTSYSAVVHETQDCFPCPRSLDTLALLGVEYVVAHLENLSGPQRDDFVWRTTAPEGQVLNDFVLVKTFGNDQVYRIKPRPITRLKDFMPDGASILLADPWFDPIRDGDESRYIGGGYSAALGYLLRDHPLYGDPRISFGEPISPSNPADLPDYAILWTRQDPNSEGYLEQNRVWANEVVSIYKRGPAKAASRNLP